MDNRTSCDHYNLCRYRIFNTESIFIAIGQFAVGVITIGQLAFGVIVLLSQVNVGLCYGIGMVTVGYGISIGMLAVGSYVPVSMGGLALILTQYSLAGLSIIVSGGC